MRKGEVLKYGLIVKDKEYTLKQNWPINVGLQCGDKGIVFNRKKGSARHTAFFEAFPLSKFVRGEGETLEQAEKACFDKAKIIFDCEHKNKIEKEGEKWSEVCSDCGAEFKFVNFKIETCALSGNKGAFIRKVKYVEKTPVESFYSPISLVEKYKKDLYSVIMTSIKDFNDNSVIKEDNIAAIEQGYISEIEWRCENIGFYLYLDRLDENSLSIDDIKKFSNFRETTGPYSVIFAFYKILFLAFRDNFTVEGLPSDKEKESYIFYREDEKIRNALFLCFAEKIKELDELGKEFYNYIFDPFFEALSFFMELYYKDLNEEELTKLVEDSFEKYVKEILNRWISVLKTWKVEKIVARK